MIHYNTQNGLSDLPRTVARAVEDLRPHANEFDSITTCGTSGLVVAAPVALALGKELVIVRKETELAGPLCHHAHAVENHQNAGRRTLFLDDEVQRGRTISHVAEQLAEHTRAEITARYEYTDRKYSGEYRSHYVPPQRRREYTREDLRETGRRWPW